MKRFLCMAFVTLTVWVILSCRSAGAQTHVTVTLTDSLGTLGTNRTVWLTPTSKTNVSGYALLLSERYVTNSGTGTFTVSNLNAGGYVLQVKAPPSDTFFRLLVTSTNLGTVTAHLITTADPMDVYPDGATAWSAGSSDLRYLASPTNSGTDGQLPQKTGDHTKWATIAGSGDVLAAGQNNFTGSNSFAGSSLFSGNIRLTGPTNAAGVVALGLDANNNVTTNVSLGGANVAVGTGINGVTNGSVVTAAIGTNDALYTSSGGTVEVKKSDGTRLFAISNDTANAFFKGQLVVSNVFGVRAAGVNNATMEFLDASGTFDIFSQPYGLVNLAPTNDFQSVVVENILTSVNQTNSGNVQSSTFRATSQFNGSGAGLTSIPNGALVNSSVTLNGSSLSLGGTRTLSVASSDFANQGTATTLLHGNASGNPSWSAVDLANDVTGNLGLSHLNGGANANSGTFWCGDGTWKAAGSSGGQTPWLSDEDANGFNLTNLVDLAAQSGASLGFHSPLEMRSNHRGMMLSSVNIIDPIVASGQASIVLGGTATSGSTTAGNNFIASSTSFSQAILGGTDNTISGSGGSSGAPVNAFENTIIGGGHNKIYGTAGDATVVGGQSNYVTGQLALAAGFRAKAIHDSAFVLSDGQSSDYSSVAANTFNARFQNGYHFDGGTFFTPTLTKTTNYTFTVADFGLFADTSGGSRTMTLTSSPLNGERHWVKKVTSDANTLTLDGNGHNIDAASTATTTIQYGGFQVIYASVPGVWYVVPGNAMTAAGLNQFGSTTSAQLAGVLSDETGSGLAVFATSPTLTTPVLGVASATSVDIGNADTTVARASAGQLSVEGVNVPTVSSTDTLTNKRITARVTTITSSATPTVNSDNCDCVTITALAAAITSMTSSLSGTPNNFDQLEYRIKDDGTARAITWGASFVAGPTALPTTTTISKCLHVYFEYDTVQAKWVCMSSGSDA